MAVRTLFPAAPVAVGVLVLLSGCGTPHPLMPLSLGRTTTYVARFGFDERVEPIRMTRRISVADAPGFELAGPLGVSRLAWRGNVLLADQTANAFFSPSIPILTEDGAAQSWEGRITSDGRTVDATATLKQKKDKITIGGRPIDTTLATLTVSSKGGVIVLDSWYEPGTGLVQQEQRTNGERIMQLQYVTAPI